VGRIVVVLEDQRAAVGDDDEPAVAPDEIVKQRGTAV
jgi:hypothetical protein